MDIKSLRSLAGDLLSHNMRNVSEAVDWAADEIDRLRADNHRLKTILVSSEEDYSYLFNEDEEEDE